MQAVRSGTYAVLAGSMVLLLTTAPCGPQLTRAAVAAVSRPARVATILVEPGVGHAPRVTLATPAQPATQKLR